MQKRLVILLNMGVSMYFERAENEIRGNLEKLQETKLTSKCGLLVSQCIQNVGKLRTRLPEDLAKSD